MKTFFFAISLSLISSIAFPQIPNSGTYTISPTVNGKPHFIGGKLSLNTATLNSKLYIEDNTVGGDSPDSRIYAIFKNNNTAGTVSQQFVLGNDGFLEIGYLGSAYGGIGSQLNTIYGDFSTVQARGGSRGLILRADASYFGADEGTIKFLTGYSNLGGPERMRINSTGNIGIGTQTPQSKLHIQNGNLTITNGDLYINQIYTGIVLKSPSSKCFKITVNDNGSLSTLEIACPY